MSATRKETPPADMGLPRQWTERVRLGIGALWIISGLLMFQPLIRSPLFFTEVLAPVAEAWQPFALRSLLHAGNSLWLILPRIWPLAIGAVELAGGAVIWWNPKHAPRTFRGAAYGLTAWSLVVWVMGEGFGNLFNGTGSVLDGTPGTALLYGACTALLLVPPQSWADGSVTYRVRQAVAWMWIMMAGLQALPGAGFWQGARLAELFGLVTMDGSEPAWLQRTISQSVMASFHDPVLVNALLVLIMLGVGIAWLVNWRHAPLATLLWVLWLWAIPQAFGALWTHVAPTPGMIGPWLVLIELARRVQSPPASARLSRGKASAVGQTPGTRA